MSAFSRSRPPKCCRGWSEGFFVSTGTSRIVGDFAAPDKAHAQDASGIWLYGVANQAGVAP